MKTSRENRPDERKQKIMDAIGCLLYVIAFVVIGAVIFVNRHKFMP